MHSKPAFILLLVSLLALFNIGLAFPADTISIQALERAANAEPALTDLAERTNSPADLQKYTDCVAKIPECDNLFDPQSLAVDQQRFNACATGLKACDLTPPAAESAESSNVKDNNIEVTDKRDVEFGGPDPSMNINIYRYSSCMEQCSRALTRCQQITMSAQHAAWCVGRHAICIANCASIPHKRDVHAAQERDIEVADNRDVEVVDERDVEIADKRDIEVTDKREVNKPVPTQTLTYLKYQQCMAECAKSRNRCNASGLVSFQHQAWCQARYLTCATVCDKVHQKREVEGADIEVRADELEQ